MIPSLRVAPAPDVPPQFCVKPVSVQADALAVPVPVDPPWPDPASDPDAPAALPPPLPSPGIKPGPFAVPPGTDATGAPADADAVPVPVPDDELALGAPASMSSPVPRKLFSTVGLSPLTTELFTAAAFSYVYETPPLVPGPAVALEHCTSTVPKVAKS